MGNVWCLWSSQFSFKVEAIQIFGTDQEAKKYVDVQVKTNIYKLIKGDYI